MLQRTWYAQHTIMIDELTLNMYIDEFLKDVSVYCAPRTIEYYRDNLDRFLDYFSSIYDVPFIDFDEFCVRDYILYLRSTNITNISINTYVRAIRTFSKWLYDKGYCQKDVCVNIKKLRPDPEPIIPLSESDAYLIECMLNSRDRIIFHLFLDAGLRLSEVINLNVEDWKGVYVVIKNSKYNKSRIVYLPPFLSVSIDNYLDGRMSGPLLLTKNNTRISKSAINKVFKRIKQDLNLNYVYPHQLRHTFATSFVIDIGNIELLRMILGHSDLSITQQYIHVAQQAVYSGIDVYELDKEYIEHMKHLRMFMH